jgi:hypothetical protein
MVHTARVYLTKIMPHSYLFYPITHAAQMMNAFPSKYKDYLALPFLLVHGDNERMRILLFLICFFHHEKDGDETQSKHMNHTMDSLIFSSFLLSPMR